MGSLFGGGKTTTTSSSSSNTTPWTPQQPFITGGLNEAQNTLNTALSNGPYTGSPYAPLNSTQSGAISQAGNYASGTGNNLTQQAAGTASGLMGSAAPYQANASGIAGGSVGAANAPAVGVLNGYATGATPVQSGVSGGLSSALNSAATNGAQAIQGFQGQLSGVANQAMSDPTQQTINAGSQYANSPFLQGQIAAAQQQTNNTLNESVLPGLNREASMGGNLNSSRAGMAEAMANRDAATVNANTAATMSGAAYNNGLTLAAQQREAGLNSATSAASSGASSANANALGTAGLQQNQGQFGTTAQLGAANSTIAANNANANTALAGNSQLGNATSMGLNGVNAANASATNNYNLAATAGGVQQASDNSQIQAAEQQYLMNQGGGYNSNAIKNYWGVVGQPLGSQTNGTGTNTQSQPSNVIGGIAGLAATAAAAYFTGGASLAVQGAAGGFGGGATSSGAGGAPYVSPVNQAGYAIGNPTNSYSGGAFGGGQFGPYTAANPNGYGSALGY